VDEVLESEDLFGRRLVFELQEGEPERLLRLLVPAKLEEDDRAVLLEVVSQGRW
jgi:hypothetical protein